jgi:phosphonate transport system permease protein
LAGWVAALVIAWPMLVLSEFKPWALFGSGNLAGDRRFSRGLLAARRFARLPRLLAKATLETLAMATAGTALAFADRRAAGLRDDARPCPSRASARGRGAWQAGGCGRPRAGADGAARHSRNRVGAAVRARARPRPGRRRAGAGHHLRRHARQGLREILESTDTRPARALLEGGSGRLAALCYGLLPHTAQELASYTVYRWECAVRASVVMGFVGAGGLGQLMDQSMKMLNGGEASSILLVFLALVLLADVLSARCEGCWHEPPAATPAGPCLRCWFAVGLIAVAVVASFVYLGIDYRALGRRVAAAHGQVHRRILPARRVARLPREGGQRALQTLAVSASAPCWPPWRAPCWRCLPRAASAWCRAMRALHSQLPAQRARAGVGRADGAGRRHRPVRGCAGAGAAHHRRAGPAVRRSAGKRCRASPSTRCTLAGAAPVPAFSYASLPIVLPQWLATRSTAGR